MTVNAERGEVELTLGGKAYPMRPSYAAIMAIEGQVGSVVALTGRLADSAQRLSVHELSVIVTETIRAAGKERGDAMLQAVKREKIAQMIVEDGVLYVIASIEMLLINMITGGSKTKKKPAERADRSE